MSNREFTPFQSWLLDRMVEYGYTPMSLAVALKALDGDVESWVAGRSVPAPLECQKIAQLFETPVQTVARLAGYV